MKISADAVATLRAAIEPLDTAELRETYRARDFPRADRVKDLDKRYRWNLTYAAGLSLSCASCTSARTCTTRTLTPPYVRSSRRCSVGR